MMMSAAAALEHALQNKSHGAALRDAGGSNTRCKAKEFARGSTLSTTEMIAPGMTWADLVDARDTQIYFSLTLIWVVLY